MLFPVNANNNDDEDENDNNDADYDDGFVIGVVIIAAYYC